MDRINVIKKKKGWSVALKDSDDQLYDTKKEAMENARSMAIENQLQLIVIDQKGNVTGVHDYRKDKLNIRATRTLAETSNLEVDELKKAIVQAQISDI